MKHLERENNLVQAAASRKESQFDFDAILLIHVASYSVLINTCPRNKSLDDTRHRIITFQLVATV